MDEKKAKKFLNKLYDLMAEAGADSIDAETLEKFEKKVISEMTENGISPTIMSLKAFFEGMTFMFAAVSKDGGIGGVSSTAMVALRTIISRKEKKIKDAAEAAMNNSNEPGK